MRERRTPPAPLPLPLAAASYLLILVTTLALKYALQFAIPIVAFPIGLFALWNQVVLGLIAAALFFVWSLRAARPAYRSAMAKVQRDGWQPPANVCTFLDAPIADTEDFFADPPEEIGPVQSAETSLRYGKLPFRRLVWFAGVYGASIGVFALISGSLILAMGPSPNGRGWLVFMLLPAYIAGIIAHRRLRFWHECCYIGQHGIARFVCRGDRDSVRNSQVLLFEKASELFVFKVHEFEEYVSDDRYQVTRWQFRWMDAENAKQFKLAGSEYNRHSSLSWMAIAHRWLCIAEAVWTTRLYAALPANAVVRFRISAHRWFALSRESLTFCLQDREHQYHREQLRALRVKDGKFFLRIDNGSLSHGEEFTIPYYEMPNARLFITLFINWYNVPVR